MNSNAGISLCPRCGKLDCDDAHSSEQDDTEVLPVTRSNYQSATMHQSQMNHVNSVSNITQCSSGEDILKKLPGQGLVEDKSTSVTSQQNSDEWKRCQSSENEKCYEYTTSTPLSMNLEGSAVAVSSNARNAGFGHLNKSTYLNKEEICKSACSYDTGSSHYSMSFNPLHTKDMLRCPNVHNNQAWMASGVMGSSPYDPVCQDISPVRGYSGVKWPENAFSQVNILTRQPDQNDANRFTYKGQLKREADRERMLEGERKHFKGSSYCQNGVEMPELSAGKETLAELITETQNILNYALLPDGCLPQKLPASCANGTNANGLQNVTEVTCAVSGGSSSTRQHGYKDTATSYCWLPPNVSLRDVFVKEPTSLESECNRIQYTPTDYGQQNTGYTFSQDSHCGESWSQWNGHENLYMQYPDTNPIAGLSCREQDGIASVGTELLPHFKQGGSVGEMGFGRRRSAMDSYVMPSLLDTTERSTGKDCVLHGAYLPAITAVPVHASSTTHRYMHTEQTVPVHYGHNNQASSVGSCHFQPEQDLSMYRADLMAPGTTLPPRCVPFPRRLATTSSHVPLQSLLLNSQGNGKPDLGRTVTASCRQTGHHPKPEDQQFNLEKAGSSNSISVVYMGRSGHEKRQLAMIMAPEGSMTWAMLDQCAGGTWSNADSRDIPVNIQPLKINPPAMVIGSAVPGALSGDSTACGAMESQSTFNGSIPPHISDYSSLPQPVIIAQSPNVTSVTQINGPDVEKVYEIKPDSVNLQYNNSSVHLNIDKVHLEQSDSGYQSLSLTSSISESQDGNYPNTNSNKKSRTERRGDVITVQDEDHLSSYFQLTPAAADAACLQGQQTEISQHSFISAAGGQEDEPSAETSALLHPDEQVGATRVQPVFVISSDAHNVGSFQSLVSNSWTDNMMPKMSTQVSVLPPVMSFLHPESATICRDTTVVSSTTQEYHTEANCPKSRFFSLLGLNIGSYTLNEQDTKKRVSRVQFQFNFGKLTYELPVMVQSIQSGVICKKSWHICLVDVSFTSIVGLQANRTELILEVNSAPMMRNKDMPHSLTNRHLLDPTGGEFCRCPYQKLILRQNVPRKIVDLLCMADRRFITVYKHDLVIDKDKRLPGSSLPFAFKIPEPKETEKAVNRNNICSCTFGCLFSRCKCAAAEQPCSDKCKCTRVLNNCINPVNEMIKYRIPMDIAKNDKCLMANIFRKKNLGKYLEKQVVFPCCGTVQVVNDVIPGVVHCPEPSCTHTYMYSWCLEKLMDTVENPRPHCDICSTCAHPSATQCPSCSSRLLPTSDVCKYLSQDMEVIHHGSSITDGLPINCATDGADGGINSEERLREAKGKTRQRDDDQEFEGTATDSETESDTEVKGNALGFILLCEKSAGPSNNIPSKENITLGVRGDDNGDALDSFTDIDHRNVKEDAAKVCCGDSLQTYSTSISVGETMIDQSVMEMTFGKGETSSNGDWPMLAGGAMSYGRTALAESSEESVQDLCNKSSDLAQLEKSFSTSLNVFGSLNSPSCQSGSNNSVPLPILIPFNWSVVGNHGDGSTLSYIQVPTCMDVTEAASNSDGKDVALASQNDENIAHLPNQQVTASWKLDISTVLPALPVSKIASSTEVISLSDVSNLPESVLHNAALKVTCQEESKCDSRDDHTALDSTAQVVSQSNNSEPRAEQNLYTVAATLQGGIVEDICVSWPLSSSDTSCVLGEPLKTSSPVTSLMI